MARRLLALLLALAAAVAVVVAPARAATTWTVTKTADTNDAACDSDCSLREAITNANADSGDTVIVPAGDYTLATSDLTVSASMTITGAGAGVTVIHAPPNRRVLEMSAGTVTISGVTLTGGNIGGAEPTGAGLEKTGGNLTLANSAVTGNTATSEAAGPRGGGIDNPFGALTIVNSTISDNHLVSTTQGTDGGGIYDGASGTTLVVTGSRITGNTAGNGAGSAADFGGGIETGTGFQISDTTIDGNGASSGSGLVNGGGIFANGGTLGTFTGDTLSNNVNQTSGLAGGGAIFSNTPLQITNSTIEGNTVTGGPATVGGGIQNNASVSLTNVTLDSNTAPASEDLHNNGAVTAVNTIISGGLGPTGNQNCSHAVTSLGRNIDSGNSCGLTGSGDLQNTDPMLGALANNGGLTFTENPAFDSPAVNAGLASKCPATDQRGVGRPQDGACDIGAVERTFSADLAVSASLAVKVVPLVGRLTYTVKVVNNGPDPATGVQLTPTLPSRGVLATAPQGCAAPCSLGTLAPGASASFTFVVNPKGAGSYPLTASLTGSRPDSNAGNNSGSVNGFAGPAALTGLSLKPRRFAPRPRGSTFSAAKGARVRFRLSRASKVRFLVQKQRRVKGKRRWVTLKGGRVERNGKAGANTVRFSGRVRHRPLKAGRYRLSLIAHDAGGTAKAKNVSFRIVAAKR